jgi:hypothetical protein
VLNAIADRDAGSAAFYSGVPVFRDFRRLMDPAVYVPLPDDWAVGIADVVQSTRAIAEKRYKAVNMAGAAVIAAVTNALGEREFPFVFGGDGASFAVAPADAEKAQAALAATAAWSTGEVGLAMRVAMVPLKAIREAGFDVRVARFAPSANLSYAMFSGGGITFADAAMKRDAFAVSPAPPGVWPDLTGLSCRFEEFHAVRGLILSVLVMPVASADEAAFGRLIESVVTLIEQSPEAAKPVPDGGPPLRWPPTGVDLESRMKKGASRAGVLASTLLYFLVMKSGIPIGRFVPAKYLRQVVENSDFRKYDDGLRMILDCTPELADALEQKLAAAGGIAVYGLHRQQGGMMTCFTLSPTRSDHVHFIDGAQGGYASAAVALKARLAVR